MFHQFLSLGRVSSCSFHWSTAHFVTEAGFLLPGDPLASASLVAIVPRSEKRFRVVHCCNLLWIVQPSYTPHHHTYRGSWGGLLELLLFLFSPLWKLNGCWIVEEKTQAGSTNRIIVVLRISSIFGEGLLLKFSHTSKPYIFPLSVLMSSPLSSVSVIYLFPIWCSHLFWYL